MAIPAHNQSDYFGALSDSWKHICRQILNWFFGIWLEIHRFYFSLYFFDFFLTSTRANFLSAERSTFCIWALHKKILTCYWWKPWEYFLLMFFLFSIWLNRQSILNIYLSSSFSMTWLVFPWMYNWWRYNRVILIIRTEKGVKPIWQNAERQKKHWKACSDLYLGKLKDAQYNQTWWEKMVYFIGK